MSEWISVKDRLPELGNGQGRNQYLVCYITPKRRKENEHGEIDVQSAC